mgnify:CR=1 FL=1
MGNVGTKVGAIVGGVIALVIGMVLATTVNTQAATTGSAANIGSFAGASCCSVYPCSPSVAQEWLALDLSANLAVNQFLQI